MISEELVKIEEESLIQGKNQADLENCIARFYNDDSEQVQHFPQSFKSSNDIYTVEDILELIQGCMDIRNTQLSDLLQIAKKHELNEEDWRKLKKALIKRKRELKRIHAKGRRQGSILKIQWNSPTSPIIDSDDMDPAELKRKRNRMSAQISRDRKKQHIKKLEYNFNALQQETQRLRIENQQLKKKIYVQPRKSNNMLTLLIILGVFFLLLLVKDLVKSSLPQSLVSIPERQQSKMIEKAEQAIERLDESKELSLPKSLKSTVIKKIRDIRDEAQSARVPLALHSELLSVSQYLN